MKQPNANKISIKKGTLKPSAAPRLHPDIHWLIDYAAGSLPLSHALCVSAHIEYCSLCQNKVRELSAIGGSLMGTNAVSNSHTENTRSEELNDANAKVLNNVWAAIEQGEAAQSGAETTSPTEHVSAPSPAQSETTSALPECVKKLVPNTIEHLNWKKLGRHLSVTHLASGDT